MQAKLNKKKLKIAKSSKKNNSKAADSFIVGIEKEIVEYFEIYHSEKHPVVKHYHKSRLFLKWAAKLLVPDFLIGHPNLWDNIKTLRKHPNFRPLRMALAAWLIFTLVAGSFGFYSFKNAPASRAAINFQMKTGYYLGDGAPKSIVGLGFKPEVLIIKSDTIAGSAVWKSSSMPSQEYSYWGNAAADDTSNQISLDSDGFTLQVSADVNTNNTIYKWIAFAGSDCSSSGTMCVGSYAGNGAANQNITTGLQPDFVWVKRTTAVAANFRTSAMPNTGIGYASFLSATADDATANYFPTGSFYGSGFTVGATNNTNGGLFYFVSFKKQAGVLDVGSYSGSGTGQPINIPGLSGVTPNFVLTKENLATSPAFNITQSYGDYSCLTTATANQTLSITKLQSGGFLVGTSAYSNAAGIGYQYFAFAGAPDPSPNESFTMMSGHYTGNGTNQTIGGVGFRPDLVIVKSVGADLGIWSTSMDYNFSHYFASSTVGLANAISGMHPDGFYVGSSATANGAGTVYEYTAYGNASSPSMGAHAANFVIGAYTGNALSRSITNLGMNPDLVVTKENSTAAGSVWSASPAYLTAGTSVYFAASPDDTTSTLFTTVSGAGDNKGFTIGTSAIVNGAGVVHNFFAFKTSTGKFSIGNYTGNGPTPQNVTKVSSGGADIGFQPDYVMVKRTTNIDGVQHSSDSNLGANTQYFKNAINFANSISGFVPGGFTVVSDTTANASGGAYHFLAWKASAPVTLPNLPINSLPADVSINANINPVLSANYSDPNSNPQTDAQWQVDDVSDFLSPLWTRTAGSAETSAAVNATNGVFAGSLAGKTELNHDTTYYWRVKYSNGTYSNWSLPTSFSTNSIGAPVNSSPADGATVTTLVPTLAATNFSDPQIGHTIANAEWQVSANGNFSQTLYDSGIVSQNNSYVLPSATLSDNASYYWRVRSQDSSGEWSDYSTPTKFFVSKTNVTVTPLFGGVVVDQGDSVNINANVKLANGAVINNASVVINIYNPTGTKIVDGQAMSYLTGSNGVYHYNYTIPSVSGSYLYEVVATSNGVIGYNATSFEVRTISADISSIKMTVAGLASDMAKLISEIGTGNIAAIKTKTDTIDWGNIASIITTSGEIKAKTDNISWTDIAAIKTKTDTINWSDVAGIKLKTDTIAWEDISGIKSNVATLISEIGTGNIAAIKTNTDSINWSDITSIVTINNAVKTKTDSIDWSQVSAIKTNTDTINWNDVTGIKVKTDTVNWGDVNDIKLKTDTIAWGDISGIKSNVATLISEIGTGNIAAIKTNTDSINWSDISAIVTNAGEIKAKTDTIDWSQVSAIKTNTDTINWNDVTGIKVKADTVNWSDVGALKTQLAQHEAADAVERTAQAVFRSDTTARLSEIKNKIDVVTTTLNTVDTSLNSVSSAVSAIDFSGVGNTTSDGAGTDEIISQLQEQSVKLSSALKTLDVMSPDLDDLLDVGKTNAKKLTEVQNKIADLKALSATTRQIVVQKTTDPVVETYMKFNSVEIHFLITNPDTTQQTVHFKALLPEEARPENVMNSDGLKLDYDANSKAYYVYGDVTLDAKESVTRKIEMKDIWMFSDDEISAIKKQADNILPVIATTQYGAQGTILKNDIDSTLDIIMLHQKNSYTSPQDHIVVYRENKEKMIQVQNSLDKLKDLVVQAGASRGMVGQVGGIQTFATWGIILAIIFGFGLLAAVIFAMWKHQTVLAAETMRILSGQGRLRNQYAGSYGISAQIETKPTRYIPIKVSHKSFSKSQSFSWEKCSIFLGILGLSIIAISLILKYSPNLFDKKAADVQNIKSISGISVMGEDAQQSTDQSVTIQESKNISNNDEGNMGAVASSVAKLNQELKILDTPLGFLNVRDQSATSEKIVAKVYPGEVYEYIGQQNGWYQIMLKADSSGWVSEKYVQTIGN